MNTKWKALLIISLVFNIAVAGALIHGWFYHSRYDRQGPFPGNGRPGRMRGMRFGERMGLPRDKMQGMAGIFDELHEQTAGLRDSLMAARSEVVDLIHSDEPDEAAVMKKIDEISAIQGELEKVLVRRLLRVHEILDPEERERFFEMLQRRMRPGSHQPMGMGEHRPGLMGGM